MIVLSITVLLKIIQVKNNIVNKRRDKPKITRRDNRKSITFFEKTIGFSRCESVSYSKVRIKNGTFRKARRGSI